MIRKYGVDDSSVVFEMMKDFYNSPAVLHKVPEDNYKRTLDEAEKGNPYFDLFILEKDGEIAGYAMTLYSYSNEAGGKVVWIDELYVKPAFQSRGLGREFIGYIKDKFGEYARIRLEVESSNDGATRLYRREGFEELGYRQYIIEKDINNGQ